nr:hypothetical protein [Tanacetum cinerariifolium]
MYCIHALLFNHQKKVQLHFNAYLSNGGSQKQARWSHAICHAFDSSLQSHSPNKPSSLVPLARFTFHEHVTDPLNISRNPSKENGKKIVSSSVISYSSSSSNDNEEPSFLEFYDELSDNEDLTEAQREKRGMFKFLNRYVGTDIDELKTLIYTMKNWPPGPLNPSAPPRVSRPPLGFPNPPPGFEPLPSTQHLFVNINNNAPLIHNNAPPLENIHHPPPNLGNQDFPNPSNILDFVHPNDMTHLYNMFCQCCSTTRPEIQTLRNRINYMFSYIRYHLGSSSPLPYFSH